MTRVNQTWRTPAPDIYRGYLIETDLLKTTWFVKRDGFTVASTPSREAAVQSIDAIMGTRRAV